MNKKRLVAALLAATMTASFVGCGGGAASSSEAPSETASSTASSTESSAASSEAPAADGAASALTYPLQGNPKVTYWVDLNPNVTASFASMNDTPLTAQLRTETGIDVEYIHPPQGQQKEAFNLMLASNDLPDIIEYAWLKEYPGGPELGFKNKVIEPLNENMEKWAPDYTAYLKATPDVDKMVRTDEGNYFGFPFIRGADELMVFYGPYLRSDWLKELNLEVPTTMDEWYNVLKQFKEKKGATAALTTTEKDMLMFNFGFLTSAYGVTTDFHVEDGKVVYGPAQPGFKDFLTEMNKWYTEGLLDMNFYTNDRKAADTNLLNDKSGAVVGYAGSGMGVYDKSIKELNPEAGYVGAPYPVVNKGDRPMIGQYDFAFMTNYQVAAVTTASKNKEAAYALLNYGYSEKGDMLYNFGIEGQSYTMTNNYPTYTDMILNPPEGKTMAQMLAQYVRSNYNGPFVQRLEYYEQYMQLDIQKDAVNLWKETDAKKYQIPPTTPTQDESKEYNAIKVNMDTWRNEWAIGAITGKNKIEDFDAQFVAEMKKLGLDRAVEIQQGAYERYNKR